MRRFVSVLILVLALTIIPGPCLAAVEVGTKHIARSSIDVKYPVVNNLEDKKIMKIINKDIEKQIKDFIKAERDANSDKRITGEFKVRYNDMDTLSITLDFVTMVKQSAYPINIRKAFNYDVNTGEQLQYGNLQNVSLDDVNKGLAKRLKEQKLDLPNFQGIDFVPHDFYIDEQGELVSIIQEQVIGPHAVGVIEFKVF